MMQRRRWTLAAGLCLALFASQASAQGLTAAGAPRGDIYDANGKRVGPFLASPLGEFVLAKVSGQLAVITLNQIYVTGSDGTPAPRFRPQSNGTASIHFEQPGCTGNAWVRLPNIIGGTYPATVEGPIDAPMLFLGAYPVVGFVATSEIRGGNCVASPFEGQGYSVTQRIDLTGLYALPLTLR